MASGKYITGPQVLPLTQADLSRIKPTEKRYNIRDSKLTGLVLRVGASGKLTFGLDYRNRQGKRQSYTIGSTDLYTVQEARKEAQRLKGGIAKGRDPAGELRAQREEEKANQTLRAFLEGNFYREHLKHKRTGEVTLKRIRYAYSPFLDSDLREITGAKLTAHREQRRDAGVTPQSLNRDRQAISPLFRLAFKKGLIDKNPMLEHDRYGKEVIGEDDRVRYLGQRDEYESYTTGELERFTEALEKQPPLIQALVRLAMNTGMRRGELFGLQWENVSFAKRLITVTAHTAKTNITRHISMNNNAEAALRAWKAAQGNIQSFHGFVFTDGGERLTNIKSQWRQLMTDAQIEDFRFHDLRHHFASMLAMHDVNLNTIRELLGHSDLKMTLRYAHLAQSHVAEAVEVLDHV